MHRAVKIPRDLITIPSVNPMGVPHVEDIYSERQVPPYVQNYLTGLRLE